MSFRLQNPNNGYFEKEKKYTALKRIGWNQAREEILE